LLPKADRPLFAIDLGCREQIETAELLARGWTLLAITDSAEGKKHLERTSAHAGSARLTIQSGNFGALVLPPADLIYTGAELPHRPQTAFGPVWSRIVPAVRRGGWFAGRFLGDHDARAPDAALTFLSRRQLLTVLSGFRIELLREGDEPGAHSFDVIARRRVGRPSA
jgi:hypothetical protein